ncbi:MAG: DUF4845 domain-containing protein [Gammaproteobacteria bacterium]|nr:DUF4845 domain-containing protein [Gammaproteobacteria bacterium]
MSRDRQRGMTMWGAMFVIAVFAFFIFIGLKLFPPYMTDFKIEAALKELAKNPNIGSMDKGQMVESLNKHFDIDNINEVNPAKTLVIEKRGKNKAIRFDYELVIPLFYNISVLLTFDHLHEVAGVNE